VLQFSEVTLLNILVFLNFLVVFLSHSRSITMAAAWNEPWLIRCASFPFHHSQIHLSFDTMKKCSWKGVVQLIKNQPVNFLLYTSRRFISMFTKARQWTLSWASWVQSPPFYIFMYSHTYTLKCQMVSPLRFLDKITGCVSRTYYMFCPSHPCGVSRCKNW
jgi:hypothetical protein